jgi:FkbM family methyltransferase
MPSLRQLLGLKRAVTQDELRNLLKKEREQQQQEHKKTRKEVQKLREALGGNAGNESTVRTMRGILQRLRERGPEVATVIDIGASDAQWTKLAREWLPQAEYLLVEAQPVHEPALKAYQEQTPKVQVVMAAAGRARGEIYFDSSEPFGGLASDKPFAHNNIVVPVTTLDDEVRERALKGPFLIKFDTHGYEIPILDGSSETLKQTSVIIMECYNFRIAPECLLFHQMCQLMADRGFRCVDMGDVVHRDKDGALWQMDMVFIRADRPEFATNRYQ